MLQSWLMTVVLAAQAGPEAGAAACAAIEDPFRRLNCYDALFRPPAAPTAAVPAGADSAGAVSGAAAAQRPAPPPAPSAVIAAERDQAAEFGLTPQQRAAKAREERGVVELEALRAQLEAIEASPTGRWLLRLDNGQTWQLVEPSQRRPFAAGEPIVIRRAALGSFLASGTGGGAMLRVRRID